MANILVYIETDGDVAVAPALEALGEGRRIATRLGASLQAVVLIERADRSFGRYGHDALVRQLGHAGADRVVLSMASGPGDGDSAQRQFAALCEAARIVRPCLVLVAATAIGRTIGPRVATRMGAAFVPEPVIEHSARGEFVFTRWLWGKRASRRLVGEELTTAIVVTLTPGHFRVETGWDDAEAHLVENPAPDGDGDPGALLERIDDPAAPSAAPPDSADPLETARRLVIAGDEVSSPEQFAHCEALADALGAALGATRAVCHRGLAGRERHVGVGGRIVAPTLCVVCGGSGADDLLAALSEHAELLVIAADPKAALFRVADYGLVGALGDVVPALVAGLSERAAGGGDA